MTALNTKALVFLALIVLLSIRVGTAHAQEAITLKVSQHAEFGDILTDAGGNTVYLFTEDERNKSNCSGGCATAWPPLLTVGDPTAGEGVNADRLGTIAREDGSTQVAYNGWPLYYFASDEEPGDTKGQYGTWFVVSAFGGPIQNNAAVDTAENAEFGTMLVEASGRSLYLFTDDERNKSNCAGGCALAWPPLLTVGDPAAGEGVNADRLGTRRDNMVLGSSSRLLVGRSRITLRSTPPRTRSLGRCWWKPAVAACTCSPTTSAISPTAPEAVRSPGPLC